MYLPVQFLSWVAFIPIPSPSNASHPRISSQSLTPLSSTSSFLLENPGSLFVYTSSQSRMHASKNLYFPRLSISFLLEMMKISFFVQTEGKKRAECMEAGKE